MNEKKGTLPDSLFIYGIWDKKAQKYDTPFFAFSDLFAKRRFMLMQEEEKSPLNMWPEDFELHRLAEFGISSGMVEDSHELILEGKSLIPLGE